MLRFGRLPFKLSVFWHFSHCLAHRQKKPKTRTTTNNQQQHQQQQKQQITNHKSTTRLKLNYNQKTTTTTTKTKQNTKRRQKNTVNQEQQLKTKNKNIKTNKGAQKFPHRKYWFRKYFVLVWGGISTYATTMCTISAQLVNQKRAQNRAFFRTGFLQKNSGLRAINLQIVSKTKFSGDTLICN